MCKYVISHDVGTSSVKTALIKDTGEIVAHHTSSYPIKHTRPGWVEQDPDDYWHGSVVNTRKVMEVSNIDTGNIIGMVFTTQAMGIIPVDQSGKKLRDNITWVDGRAYEQARWMMNLLGGRTLFTKIIGTEITGKDVLPKLRWLKQNEPDVYRKMDKVLDVNGYLKFRATGKMVFEWSGACSYVFDLKTKKWVTLLFRLIGFDVSKLPSLVRSTDVVGTLTKEAAEDQFGFLMNAFKFGAPLHAGIAFGFDRLVSMFAGLDSIRDVIAFPKNNSGRDVMNDSPSPIAQAQLDELYLKLVKAE